MEMCIVCDNIQLTKWFASPKEYLQCLNYIQKLLDSDDFEMDSQTCDLDKVKNDKGYWVDDLDAAMSEIGYSKILSQKEMLPKGKALLRLDYRKD